MRVKVNSVYKYEPCGIDRFDARTNLKPGDLVRVVNLHGCPPANTMGHCYVAYLGESAPYTPKLVCTGSLTKVERACTATQANYLLGDLRRLYRGLSEYDREVLTDHLGEECRCIEGVL